VVGGVFGVFVAFITPALLHLHSRRIFQKAAEASSSVHSEVAYTWHFSHSIYVYLILLFAIAAVVFVALPAFA